MSIDICNETGAEVDVEALVGLVRHVLAEMRIHPLAELSVLLVDAATMENLNRRWMDETGPTDVLAFPMDELRPGGDEAEEAGLLGDLVLCPEVAAVQAAEAGHSTARELAVLTAHGLLHLLGYDHAIESEHREMFSLQERLLRDWSTVREAGAGS